MNESLSLSLSLSLFFKTNFIWFFWTVIGKNFNFINILPVFWLFEFGFILSIGVGVSVGQLVLERY